MREWLSARALTPGLRRALRERRRLRARPWEEHLLHWAKDGSLHGHRLPPPGPRGLLGRFRRRRRLSTTTDGWCPAWAEEVQRQYLPDPEAGPGRPWATDPGA